MPPNAAITMPARRACDAAFLHSARTARRADPRDSNAWGRASASDPDGLASRDRMRRRRHVHACAATAHPHPGGQRTCCRAMDCAPATPTHGRAAAARARFAMRNRRCVGSAWCVMPPPLFIAVTADKSPYPAFVQVVVARLR